MVVAFRELDLQLDAREEGGRWMEDESVRAGSEPLREARPAVRIGRGARHEGAVRVEFDRDAPRGTAGGGVEHMRGERAAHAANLLAWAR